ncbi:MAG: class I SAM-dependent rRNA methyltransferase, partial [Aliihoeflea sp.]
MKKKDNRQGAKLRAGQDNRSGKPGSKPPRQKDAARTRAPDYVRPAATAPKEKVQASAPAVEAAPPRPLKERSGGLPTEQVPVILESLGAGDFHLIDSGNGLKLEQYGEYRIVRPEAQALWRPSLAERVWDNADAIFTGDTDEEGSGRWRFPKQALGETWPLSLLGVDFLGRFTAFRHVGVFPEQIVHWEWLKQTIEKADRPLKVLNLFGYTGVASLVAASAGAEVTHVDASKKAIGWARENQALAGLENAPIRWI